MEHALKAWRLSSWAILPPLLFLPRMGFGCLLSTPWHPGPYLASPSLSLTHGSWSLAPKMDLDRPDNHNALTGNRGVGWGRQQGKPLTPLTQVTNTSQHSCCNSGGATHHFGWGGSMGRGDWLPLPAAKQGRLVAQWLAGGGTLLCPWSQGIVHTLSSKAGTPGAHEVCTAPWIFPNPRE